MKRIIICSDGTWNTPDSKDREKIKPSNVVKMLRAIKSNDAKGVTQVVFYDEGVGTNNILDLIIGGIAGHGLEKNTLDCYRFLVNNYSEGDEIFLFGFSRGAYTVRSLAGLIEKCGLLKKHDAFYISDAYDIYKLDAKGSNAIINQKVVEQFRIGIGYKKRNSAVYDVNIKFIGVWDTVGSLGIPVIPFKNLSVKKHQFHNTSLGSKVLNAFHALAIDEKRKPFKPTLWNKTKHDGQKLEQKWFAGVHTNIGGGYKKDGLANYAFLWIKDKANECGLETDSAYTNHFREHPDNDELRNSMTLFWRLFGSHIRPIGRKEYGNESVHKSALQRFNNSHNLYQPKNLDEYLNAKK